MFGGRSQNHYQIDVRVGDERLLVTESMQNIELCRILFRGFFLAARYRNYLKVLEGLQCGDVPVFCPATRANNTYSNLFVANNFSLKQS